MVKDSKTTVTTATTKGEQQLGANKEQKVKDSSSSTAINAEVVKDNETAATYSNMEGVKNDDANGDNYLTLTSF